MPLCFIPGCRYVLSLGLALLVVASLHAQGPPGGNRRGGGPPDGRGRPDGPPPEGREHPERFPPGSQDRPEGGPRRGRPPADGPGMFNILSSEMRFGDKPVKGVPYSAQIAIESARVLPDGTRITHKVDATIYRDGDGRVRREQSIGIVGNLGTGSNDMQMVFITDPKKGAHYVINPEQRTVRQMTLHRNEPPPPPPPPGDATVTESLGKKNLEGIEAEGTRTTTTIPAGQIGNDRPIKIVSERWYSKELQIVLLSSHNDPRLGEHTYRVTSIKREEPVRTLFEIPSNYTIEQDKAGPRRGDPPHRDGEKSRPAIPFKKPGLLY